MYESRAALFILIVCATFADDETSLGISTPIRQDDRNSPATELSYACVCREYGKRSAVNEEKTYFRSAEGWSLAFAKSNGRRSF